MTGEAVQEGKEAESQQDKVLEESIEERQLQDQISLLRRRVTMQRGPKQPYWHAVRRQSEI